MHPGKLRPRGPQAPGAAQGGLEFGPEQVSGKAQGAAELFWEGLRHRVQLGGRRPLNLAERAAEGGKAFRPGIGRLVCASHVSALSPAACRAAAAATPPDAAFRFRPGQ